MLRLVFRKTNASRPQRPAAVQWMLTSTFAVPQRLSVEVTGAGVLSDTLLNDRFPPSAKTIERRGTSPASWQEVHHRPHRRTARRSPPTAPWNLRDERSGACARHGRARRSEERRVGTE